MASDPRIQSIAQLLVDKHGEESLAIATERAHDRLGIQDYPSAIIWTRVAEAIHVLRPDAKPERTPGRIGASLDELMDDPVMTAMVQDDDGRRGEIRDTMTRAKHKLQHKRRKK
jgi:hypothetical protein